MNTPLFDRYLSVKDFYPENKVTYFSPNSTISVANKEMEALIFTFDENAKLVKCNYKENLFYSGKGRDVNEVTLPDDLANIYHEIKMEMDLDAKNLKAVQPIEQPIEDVTKEETETDYDEPELD